MHKFERGKSRSLKLEGRKFGELTVIKRAPKPEHLRSKEAFWECLCTCGNTCIKRSSSLVRDESHIGCGCQRGYFGSHGMSKTRTYRIWVGLRARCKNPNHHAYASYGGRGIKVHPSWDNFKTFFKDMGECPEGLSIDRIDVDGNYEPGNCRWATHKEQNNNQRKHKNGKI